MSGFHVLMYHEIIKKEDFDINNNSGIHVAQEYHDILPKPLFVFLEEFEKQMKYLYDNGYITLKLQDVIDFFYNGKPLPEKAVLLTFDDMYKSILLYAYPVLKKYQFSAVGFVVLDWLFKEAQGYDPTRTVCLSKDELEKMKDVFEYANHSKALHTRKEGMTALQTVDKSTFCEDITACQQYVQGKKVYAYPFGVFTDEVVDWLKESGFLLAFTSKGGKNSNLSDPLRLFRNGVFLDYDIDMFKEMLND